MWKNRRSRCILSVGGFVSLKYNQRKERKKGREKKDETLL